MNYFLQGVERLSNEGVCASVVVEGMYRFELFDSIHSVGDWDEYSAPENVFLQKKYLEIVEDSPPSGMQFCYAKIRKNNRVAGIAIFQIIHFNADKSLQQDERKENPCFFHFFGSYLKGLVAKRVDFDTLVCGSLLLTGEHGFYFDPQQVGRREGFVLLRRVIDGVLRHLSQKRGIPASLVLCKDFYEGTQPHAQELAANDYNEFRIQPNMVLPLQPDWQKYGDYLAAMSSKYRMRAKRAVKKAGHLQFREMGAAEVKALEERMYELYLEVARGVGFNVLKINQHYFSALKHRLGDACSVVGCFDGAQLVGFYTTIQNYDELEAHFLGFEAAYNPSAQIYLNFLYKIVEQGIALRSKRIVFARTALEIKSSVGAAPHEMYAYMQHTNSIVNRFLPPLLDYLKPNEDWHQRHPFKDEGGVEAD
jgi:hypothetical protein